MGRSWYAELMREATPEQFIAYRQDLRDFCAKLLKELGCPCRYPRVVGWLGYEHAEEWHNHVRAEMILELRRTQLLEATRLPGPTPMELVLVCRNCQAKWRYFEDDLIRKLKIGLLLWEKTKEDLGAAPTIDLKNLYCDGFFEERYKELPGAVVLKLPDFEKYMIESARPL